MKLIGLGKNTKALKKVMKSRNGLTLVELLLYMGIFSLTIAAFIAVLVSILRIQTHQSGEAEVNQQSQFLLQRIQYYVEQASLVDIPQDVATTSLKLYLGINSQDPTYIKLQSGTVYLQQTATGALQPLTSNKVTVSNIIFTRHLNPPGHDTVSVAFTVGYNSPSVIQDFTQSLQTSIARVSAATFDSSLIPSSTATYNLGQTGALWSSINQIINFYNGNVGINVTTPSSSLEVSGNIRVDSGDLYVFNSGKGVLLKDSGGNCWRLTVNTSGTLSTGSASCP